MNKLLLFTFLICFSSLSFGQYENILQPDSIYSVRKVKNIFIYDNSLKDLIKIVEFDQSGKRKRIEYYTPSFDRQSRKRKFIIEIATLQYNSNNKFIKRIDSTFYPGTPSKIQMSLCQYDSENNLLVTRYYDSENKSPRILTRYSYDPYKRTSINIEDSIVTSQGITEYDKDFYTKQYSSWSFCQTLEEIKKNKKPVTKIAYDRMELNKCTTNRTIKNTFNSKGQLIKSDIKSIYDSNRKHEYQQNYKYYKNGLIKSITGDMDKVNNGYTPWYYKYEFWK